MSGYGKAQKVSYSTMYNYIATNDEQEEKNQITLFVFKTKMLLK